MKLLVNPEYDIEKIWRWLKNVKELVEHSIGCNFKFRYI